MTWLIDIHIPNKNNSWLCFFDGQGSGKKGGNSKKRRKKEEKKREKKRRKKGEGKEREKKRGENLFLEFDFKSD